MGKRELIALLSLSSWCLVIVVCLQFVIVIFPDHTHLLFLYIRVKPFISKHTCLADFILKCPRLEPPNLSYLVEVYFV